MNVQTLRLGLQQNKFPFGEAILTSKNRYTYHINPALLKRYLEGTIYETKLAVDTHNCNSLSDADSVILDKLWTEHDTHY